MARALLVDGEHLIRLMRLCRTIQGGKGTTMPQLQHKLRTSRRTVFRDLKDLAAVGIQVSTSPDGYRLKSSLAQCRKLLADSQLNALHKLLDSCLK